MNNQDVAIANKKTVNFPFGNTETTIKLGNLILAEELEIIKTCCTEAIIIADRRVNKIWNNEVYDLLLTMLPVHLYTINAEETEKSLGTVCNLLEAIMDTAPSRSCAIVSFGGGLTGNIAGLISGLLFRGVRLIHIPTTLLAMSDSILSQKQAVNGQISKNSFGLYHKAMLNIIDIKYLSTLPVLQIYSGIIEIAKNCLAFDREAIDSLRVVLQQPFTTENLLFLVELGIAQKRGLLEQDPYEREIGMVLEYGHTIGHSLEITMVNLHHGQAVGLGMLAAAYISSHRGWITRRDIKLHVELLRLCQCPLRISGQTDIDKVMLSVNSDNKKGKIAHTGEETPMVLLEGIGKVRTGMGSYLVPVSFSEIKEALFVLQTDYFEKLVDASTDK
jgi:3-dehydroquinate synthetase